MVNKTLIILLLVISTWAESQELSDSRPSEVTQGAYFREQPPARRIPESELREFLKSAKCRSVGNNTAEIVSEFGSKVLECETENNGRCFVTEALACRHPNIGDFYLNGLEFAKPRGVKKCRDASVSDALSNPLNFYAEAK